jgi:hypothetical protein
MSTPVRNGFLTVLKYFILFGVVILVSWLIAYVALETSSTTERTMKPGEEYKIGNRSYRFPELPLRKENNGATLNVMTIPILREEYLMRMRVLLIKFTSFAKMQKLNWCLSGNTLLGFIRHLTFIPWYDTLHVYVNWEHREYLWSQSFVDDCAQEGLEIMRFMTTTLEYANEYGSTIRLRLRGKRSPYMCIHLISEVKPVNEDLSEPLWGRVDGWEGDEIKFSVKERFTQSHLFEFEEREIDGIKVNIPSHSVEVLKTLFGEDVLEIVTVPISSLIHDIPGKMIEMLYTVQKPTNA